MRKTLRFIRINLILSVGIWLFIEFLEDMEAGASTPIGPCLLKFFGCAFIFGWFLLANLFEE